MSRGVTSGTFTSMRTATITRKIANTRRSRSEESRLAMRAPRGAVSTLAVAMISAVSQATCPWAA